MVKTINVSFDEEEYKRLKQQKGELSWHDLIVRLGNHYIETKRYVSMALDATLVYQALKPVEILGTLRAIGALADVAERTKQPAIRTRALELISEIVNDKKENILE